jgi:endonuclease/exonuclease/phosphatase family metal-dependent hydrolase
MNRLRVLTLNLWAQHGPWPARAAAVCAGLVAEQPDVVALQEVLCFPGGRSQLDELTDGLPAGLYPERAYGPACTLAGGRTFGNALLSRFPIVEQRTVALPNPHQREPRALLCALVALPGGQLPVFVTHLDWQLDSSYARCQQVRFIADQIDLWVAAAQDRPGASVLPPLLAGDFNAEPGSDEIRFLTGHHALPGPGELGPRGVYFTDCYARASDPAERAEADGATFCRKNPFAARAREPDRRLDYLFIGLPDAKGRGEPLRAWRCFQEPHVPPVAGARPGSAWAKADAGHPDTAVFASDHYGVAADLSA